MANQVVAIGAVHDNDPATAVPTGINGDSPVIVGGIYESTQPTYVTGDVGRAHISSRGSLLVTPGVEGFPVTVSAGSAIIGKVSIDQTTPGTTNGTSFVAAAAGGVSAVLFANSGLLTNAVQSIKSSAAGSFYGFQFFFDNSTKAFIQLFDVATSGAVSLGSTSPTYVMVVPPYGYDKIWPVPLAFTNGLQAALTTTATGSSAVTGTALQGFAFFK